jgi:hypothetical protein
MKRSDKKGIPQERDRHLDVPAEANRDKHINFLEAEEQETSKERSRSDSPLYIPDNAPSKDCDPEGGNRA